MGYKFKRADYCAIIFAIIVLGVGYVFSSFVSSMMADLPEGFGPPSIIVWMPMIMTSIPLIICVILNIRLKLKKPEDGPTVHRYRDETTVYTGDYSLDVKPSEEKDEKPVYLIPAECPSCDSPLNAEYVDWVGPLQAKCPNCETIVEAKEKIF